MVEIAFNENLAREITAGVRLGRIKTKDGFPVEIIHWNVRPSFPIAGIVRLGDDCDYVRMYTREGKSDIRRNVTKNTDLVLEVEGGEV
jgi:hypothetical protein